MNELGRHLVRLTRLLPFSNESFPTTKEFFFDNATSHMKRPEDALNVKQMNVKDGGRQPFMCNTVWEGNRQAMVTIDRLQKGMKTGLQERGINTVGMSASHMRNQLWQFQASFM